MPIEIRELVIRATVNPAGGGSMGGVGGCDAPSGRNAAGGAHEAGAGGAGGGDELVQACVREVMRLLEQKSER